MRAWIGACVVAGSLACGGCFNARPPSPPDPAPKPLTDEETAALVERSVALLFVSTDSENANVRANAVEALSRNPVRLRKLAETMLYDENLGVRTVTALALGRNKTSPGPESMERLREMLDAPSPYERAAALLALQAGGARVDPGMLAEMLLLSDSPRVRMNAAMVLGLMGDTSARPLLRQAAQRMPQGVAEGELKLLELQIAESLLRLGDYGQVQVLRAALYPSRPADLEATAVACQMLGELRDRGALDELYYLVQRVDQDGRLLPPEVRLAAVEAMGKIGLKEGAYVARENLRNERPEIVAQAAVTLGSTGAPGDGRLLEPLLDDPDERIRVSAATGVIRLYGG